MKHIRRNSLNIRKAVRFAVVINALQVAAMVAVIAYVLLFSRSPDRFAEAGALGLALLVVTWGAVLDIRDARGAERMAEQARMLEDAYGQLEALNITLRRQRHDFMNHLQVVFSLMEMKEYPDAMQYVESVYGDIQMAGGVLKTAIPAVNALIAAKRTDCLEHGIRLELEIRSSLKGLPLAGWEMCRVLGNLIDNARDALLTGPGAAEPRIDLRFDETPDAFTFAVVNNGPAIPPQHLPSLFKQGFTTKSDGHGSGLAIVKEIVEDAGGTIEVASVPGETSFTGTIPKSAEN